MKKKNIISLILSVILLISTTSVFAKDYSDYPQKFWDVSKSHWAYNYISELTDKNVISGYDDGSFKPENTVSRAEWSKMMVTASKLEINKTDYSISDLNKDHWAYNYVITAKDYMNWYQNGDSISFRPNQSASREDVTVSLVKLKGYSVKDVDYSSLSAFKDIDSISNDLKKYVAVALEKNLISGFEDNTFRGQDTLTRAEAATLLCRAFQMGDDNKIVDFKDFFKDDDNKGISETTKPVELPTPTPYVEPEPTKRPIAEPLPNPTTKPIIQMNDYESPNIDLDYLLSTQYKIETLVDVVLPSTDFYTYAGDDLFYFDQGVVRKINMVTREQDVVCDTNNMRIPIDGVGYIISDVHQIISAGDGTILIYANIKNGDDIMENVLITPMGDGGELVEYNKEKIKDDIGNNYHINSFIGQTEDGNSLLYSAKCNEDSYCHAMLNGIGFKKGYIMDPNYLQPEETEGWKPFDGFADTGYNSTNVTTFEEFPNGIYLSSYNRLFWYDFHNLVQANAFGPTSEFAASFVNDRAWYTIDKDGDLCVNGFSGPYDGACTHINFYDFDQVISDGKPVDFSNILPICIVDSFEDITFYDKTNNCFRILKAYRGIPYDSNAPKEYDYNKNQLDWAKQQFGTKPEEN